MANLRLLSISIVDSTNLSARFSASLSQLIEIGNISISSETPGVLDPSVLKATIVGNTIEIVTQPLVPQAAYFITFVSTDDVVFKSLNGTDVLITDGIGNKSFFIGPIESNNPIKNSLNDFYNKNVYDLENPSKVSKYIDSLSLSLSKALYEIGQVKNDNYLSFTVTDELKTRGPGPYDRLNEEGAYEILRVGLNSSGIVQDETIEISNFPDYPVSLISTEGSDSLTVSNEDGTGTFNLKTLTVSCTKSPVISISNIRFIYNSILPPFDYDVSEWGYQIKNSKYDPDNAFTYVSLLDNQFKLSETVLTDESFSLENIASITIDYFYKNEGKIVNSDTLEVNTVLSSGRESVPAIQNIFTLKHAPIVSSNNVEGEIGDVSFIDPNAYPGSNTPHPAFTSEIFFRFDYLPSRVGEYSIDYSTGTVYVFGQDRERTGTGPYPPLALYNYRHKYENEIDYVYDESSYDISSLPNGSLVDEPANISYEFEQVLVKGTDYLAEVHKESLSERVDNKLVALNAIETSHFPITNVFRIFNETTGEIYRISRWTNNKIFFNYQTAPEIKDETSERATFDAIINETLFIGTVMPVSVTKQIFKISLQNNNIISASEDSLGFIKNSSVDFSDTSVFSKEYYYDNDSLESVNNAKLTQVGDYQIDYSNGIVWVLVLTNQDLSIGTVSYKRGYVKTNNDHIVSVNDIFYRFGALSEKVRSFDYISFTDTLILPRTFDKSNESYLTSNNQPYQIFNSNIGSFDGADFTIGVSDYVKYVRGIFERQDLLNSSDPVNFATAATFNGKSITVGDLNYSEYHSVEFDGYDYFVYTSTNLPYISPNIDLDVSITRLSDSAELWDSGGTIEVGSPFKLILSGINSPQVGDSVRLDYSFSINDLSRVTVDYSRGDYLVDYSYLADEIIVSYEYGDNVLDFSKSTTVESGDNYYVTYKSGALRNALLRNFGTLIDIPILNNLNVDFPRERYRDALIAAMQSFTQGPTLASLKNIVQGITHSPPEIIESAFRNWSLATSLLSQQDIEVNGDVALYPGKYGNGLLISDSSQSVSFPVTSNLRIEEGTVEMWVIPQWNGIDNQSSISFEIIKDGYSISDQEVFIGPAEDHPVSVNGVFEIKNTNNALLGMPNKNKDGIYFYLTPDSSGLFNRWCMDIVDGYSDGYVASQLVIKATADGKFYDVKKSSESISSDGILLSGNNKFTYKVNGAFFINEGITFTSDYEHYLFDFAKEANKNRFSIFRDASGYINFKVIDKNGHVFIVSADVSSWKAGEQHHVATSWILNSKNKEDEMHLFIDGQEVSNIIKYGSEVSLRLHQKFRTISSEEIIGETDRPIVGSTDLTVTSGNNTVTSSLNFTDLGIEIGDIIYIQESGFNDSGYTITNVNGTTLTLSTTMPISASSCNYSINKLELAVDTQINLFKNIAVSVLHSISDGYDLQTTASSDQVSSPGTNFESLGVVTGYLLKVNETGFENYYIITDVSGNTLTLADEMPLTDAAANFLVYSNEEEEIPGQKALFPSYQISRDQNYNNILTITDSVMANDIILIRTLGLNHGRIKNKYYVWGNTSNTLNTRLPSPISLDDVKIYHTVLDRTTIGPSNSTVSLGTFTSQNIQTDQPSVSDNGRTMSVTVSGDNVDYSTSVSVAITGTVNGTPSTTSTLVFSENGTKETTVMFSQIDYVVVTCKPITSTKNCLSVKIRETYPITTAESSSSVPVIRYSYQMLVGNTLVGTSGSAVVTDTSVQFSTQNIGNYLVIYSPGSVAGQYLINDVSDDLTQITLDSSLADTFSGGNYEILNISKQYSGLQNGKFTFEEADEPGTAYTLNKGLYELDYHSPISVSISCSNLKAYVGSDFNKENQANAIIDDFCILDTKISDTRIGESLISGQDTVTKHYNSLTSIDPDSSTLMLLDFDTEEITNNSKVYLTSNKDYIQSSYSVNSNFNKSISFTDKPMLVDNSGILNTKTEGTIEFWVNPLHDTGNDPNYRFYFDASGAVTEYVTSTNNATVAILGRASQVLNVKLINDNKDQDYYGGGRLDDDSQTIFLNKRLPNQETPVVVTYIPTGVNGDRISIYKDPFGYINFLINGSGTSYQVSAPVYWNKNSWHKLRAQYTINQGLGTDEMRFFIDGYEQGNVLFGNGLLFGQNQVFGSSYVGHNSIQSSIPFTDTINEFTIGSDYTGTFGADALIDNLRISNVSRPIFSPFGESIDVGYSANLDVVYPATEDLFTTLLLDFNKLAVQTTDFAVIKNKKSGLFDITINVFDSFGILKENNKCKSILETLLSALKPANSRLFINYK